MCETLTSWCEDNKKTKQAPKPARQWRNNKSALTTDQLLFMHNFCTSFCNFANKTNRSCWLELQIRDLWEVSEYQANNSEYLVWGYQEFCWFINQNKSHYVDMGMWGLPVCRYKGNSANINKMINKNWIIFRLKYVFKLNH